MPRYYSLGKIPPKRHTQFRDSKGDLYQEELFGTAGFVGMSSLIYHLHPPTVVTEVKRLANLSPKIGIEKNMRALSFKGFSLKPEEDYIDSRKVLLMNNDLQIGLAAPKRFSKDYFFRNLQSFVWHYDLPLIINDCVAIKLLSERARSTCTVFLSGEGADGLFGGYERFFAGNLLSKNMN